MKIQMEVGELKATQNTIGDERIEVTLTTYKDHLTVTMKPHEARAYTLGRVVNVTITPAD